MAVSAQQFRTSPSFIDPIPMHFGVILSELGQYASGVLGLAYMSILYGSLLLLLSWRFALPLLLLAVALEIGARRSASVLIHGRVARWIPSLATLGMLLWTPPFFQPQTGSQRPTPWPGKVVLGLLAIHVALLVAVWMRERNRRWLAPQLYVQLWLAASVCLVSYVAMTPGGALGAL